MKAADYGGILNDSVSVALAYSRAPKSEVAGLPVSVAMPVYNVAPFLDAAIGSILSQTHRDFEFLIRDDGSTDGTAEALDRWARRDSRIRVFHGDRQMGPAESSNWIVARAQHALVARMDGDDVSHPDRLRRQVAIFGDRADVGLVGTLYRTIDASGAVIRGRDRSRLVHSKLFAPFSHGSIMYRRVLFERIGGYRQACDFWEDQDLFIRLSRLGKVVVIPEALFDYRYNVTSTRLVSERGRVERSVDLGYRCLDAFSATGDYEAVLRDGPAERADPRAIVSVAKLELWAYKRPAVLGRLIAHARSGPSLKALPVLSWALWAWVSPASLRWVSRTRAKFRDAMAASQVSDDRPYEWPLSRVH